MFFFQYYVWPAYTSSARTIFKLFVGTDSIRCTYLDRIADDGLPILDNKPEPRVMVDNCQGLRANTSSDIDNQRALRKVFPVIPYKIRRFKGMQWMHNSRTKPSKMALAGNAFFRPLMAAPNRARRNLLSGRSNQLHMSTLTSCALLKAALFGS